MSHGFMYSRIVKSGASNFLSLIEFVSYKLCDEFECFNLALNARVRLGLILRKLKVSTSWPSVS